MSEPRVAVITGAAGGIGSATAGVLLERGWTVHGWDLKAGTDTRVRWHTVDVADPAQVERAARELASVSFVLNAAGVGEFGPVAELDPRQWDRVISINLSGTFYVGRFLHPALVAGHAVVVNIASTAAVRAGENRAMYSTSKACVLMLTQVQALEWAADGVRVLSICPGYIRTPMVQEAIDTGRVDEAQILSRIPQQRMIPPRELAEAIAGLMDPSLRSLVGQAVALDSGWLTNGFV